MTVGFRALQRVLPILLSFVSYLGSLVLYDFITMVNHVAIGESLEGLRLPRKEGLILRNYMAKYVNNKIATGNHTGSSQPLLNELLDKVKGEYNSGEAPWASRVLDQVTRDQSKARGHLEDILNAQIKRRGYYPDDGSSFRASKSHTTSEGPEDHSDSDCKFYLHLPEVTDLHFAPSLAPYRPSPEDSQRVVPGHTYETRAGQQFGGSAPASGVADANDPNTINVNTQGSSAPERSQGSRSGPSTSKNGTIDASGKENV